MHLLTVTRMTDLQRSHAELRAAEILAGKDSQPEFRASR
jgi:hypothetical protein